MIVVAGGQGSAHSPSLAGRPSASPVLAIYQSNYTTAQGNFTVSMKVASTAGISLVYFTFCQLSSPLCYLPVAMTLQGTDWYVGTTHPMTSYPGMTVGIHAGYNITIQYSNNSNFTQPSARNPFTNLSVAQSVTGSYYFEMTVRNQLYGLSGVVTDAATGKGVAGAKVTIDPGNNSTTSSSSGAYTFSGLANGTYTLTVIEGGYRTTSSSIAISGQSAQGENIALSNASSAPNSKGPGGSTGASFGGVGVNYWAAISIVVVLAILIGMIVFRRRGRPPSPPTDQPAGSVGPTEARPR